MNPVPEHADAFRGLDHLARLAELQEAFAAAIRDVDPGTAVPWCGRWQVRDLVVHLARIHRWAAAEARDVAQAPPALEPVDLERLYRNCAAELRAALTDLGPDAVGRTLDGPGPAAFWRRRQLHETLVHLWDLRTAGGAGLDVEPEVWADTVDEVVTVMQPRQVRLGRMAPLARPVALVATDAGRRWCLRPGPDATGTTGTGGDAPVTVRAPASVLALMLWRRVGPDDPRLTVTGDDAVLRAALEQPLTP